MGNLNATSSSALSKRSPLGGTHHPARVARTLEDGTPLRHLRERRPFSQFGDGVPRLFFGFEHDVGEGDRLPAAEPLLVGEEKISQLLLGRSRRLRVASQELLDDEPSLQALDPFSDLGGSIYFLADRFLIQEFPLHEAFEEPSLVLANADTHGGSELSEPGFNFLPR